MPELPEVEEVRRTLEPHLLHQRIRAIRILRADFVTPVKAPVSRLVGRAIVSTKRHGKKLFLHADDGQTLVIHLGMSGRIDCVPADSPMLSHTHVVISLGSGTDI